MAKTITLPEKPKAINLPRVTRELVQCQMCGYCIDVCEAHRQTPWESVTARGKIYYLNQLDKAGFGLVDKILGRKVKISPEFVDAIYKCTGCGNCEEICHAKIELVKLWENVRTWLVQQGVAPLPVHKGIAQKIAKTGNSFGEPASQRDAWWPADVERSYAPDAILFAGCTGSYRMQHIPAAGATVLSRAGVRINCMGEDEVCCTSPLLRTGIKDLTLDMGMKIVTKADGMGAKDMVMTCAGCYKTISSNIGNFYSKTGQNVYHFTQYVDKLIKERKLPLNNEFKAKVTYHDPCHLGRHSKVYEEPRNILKKIKGIEFVEMERNRENSRCCGAGGGYKSAFNDFAVNIAMERIHDAEAVGADVIATACPFCVLNLKAGAKKAGSKIKVMDISEILLQVTAPKVEEPAPAPAPVEAPKAEPAAAPAAAEAKPAEPKPEEAPAPKAEEKPAEAPVAEEKPAEKKEEEKPAEEEAAPAFEEAAEEGDEGFDVDDSEWDLTPEGIVRRAAWNKGLRCRRQYGPYEIPVAFVKGKLGVFVDAEGAASACRKALEDEGWVIVNYRSVDITDGATQAEELRDIMKSQLRALKKGKKKKKA
ncbi:MAG: 4Fe-4S dicluster domain-containing protein [Candidatus Methanomethylophilaceae archaeon]|nr:4Fe-4S dicluster domain-containing protein [Candidatus Methanomethylophilaceae archaeon]